MVKDNISLKSIQILRTNNLKKKKYSCPSSNRCILVTNCDTRWHFSTEYEQNIFVTEIFNYNF